MLIKKLLKNHSYRRYKTKFLRDFWPSRIEILLNICNWAKEKLNENDYFTKNIIFANESTVVKTWPSG